MLRQALDEAEGKKREEEQQQLLLQQQQQYDETTGLQLPEPFTKQESYGATSHSHDDEDEEEDDEEEDDEEERDESDIEYEGRYFMGGHDDWSDASPHHRGPKFCKENGWFMKAWENIKSCVVVIANVENLWDSSDTSSPLMNQDDHHHSPSGPQHHMDHHGHDEESNETSSPQRSRRNYLVVLFWFVVLAGSYAMERSSFKLLVDRSGPFRLFSVEMVTAAHATMLGIWMVVVSYSNASESSIPLGIPLVDVGYMALLDTFHLVLVFLTGRNVCPTLTVILVQFTLPLAALLTQFVHPDGRCGRICCRQQEEEDEEDEHYGYPYETSQHFGNRGRGNDPLADRRNDTATTETSATTQSIDGAPLPGWGGLSKEHLWGSLILALAVIVALAPSIYSIINPAFFVYADPIPMKTAYNTLLYVSSCFPAAASQLYKEHVFLQNKQPVNASYLNFLLSLFQLVVASVLAPLVFCLEGFGAGEGWTSLYPSSHFSSNFFDAIKCFFGFLESDKAQNDYPEPATCSWSFGLVLMHAFSIIAVGCAVDKIVNAGATKVMYRGISAGIIVAVVLMYEYDMHTTRFNYGPFMDSLNLLCLILLVVGSEVYHRVSIQGAAFETEYPVLEGLYDDEQ